MNQEDGQCIPQEYTIRKAQPADLELIPEVEREAISLFESRAQELGIPTDRPPEVNSIETLRKAQEANRLWVAADSTNSVVGFALALDIDDFAHLDELDVLPAHGQKGLGSALLDAVCSWAKSAGFAAVTLSTFRDVPWNGPFYQRRGFQIVKSFELPPGLVRIIEIERAKGLRIDLRAIMRKSTDGM